MVMVVSFLLEVAIECWSKFYQDQDLHQELDGCFSYCIKNFKEDLKPLSGVSKSQVRELVVAADQRKK